MNVIKIDQSLALLKEWAASLAQASQIASEAANGIQREVAKLVEGLAPAMEIEGIIPTSQKEFFESLPDEVKSDIIRRFRMMKIMGKTSNLSKTSRELAQKKRGYTAASILDLYYRFSKYGKKVSGIKFQAGDWRCLLDLSKVSPSARLKIIAAT